MFIPKEHKIDTDVLIIGGGPAGMWCAKQIKEHNSEYDVLIVEKGPAKWGGQMSFAGGDFTVMFPEDDLDQWMEDLVCYFDGICEQDLMEEMLKISYDRFMDYQNMGCQHMTDANGDFKRIAQRGLKNVKLVPTKFKGRGGEEKAAALGEIVDDLNVPRMGRTMITGLIKTGNAVTGAVGFNVRTGDFYSFHAKVVVLASGLTCWKSYFGKNQATGEMLQMAYEAGVDMRNFEFATVWNTPKLFAWEGQTTLMPLGAKFINAKGEAIMDKYSPVLKANTDPHFLTVAMAKEYVAKNAPIYFDVSNISEENRVLVRPQNGWQLLNYEKLATLGVDLFASDTEWNPQLNELIAGIATDIDGACNIEGLYATGRIRSIEPGLYFGGYGLFMSATTGYMTGNAVAEYLDTHTDFRPFNEEMAQKEKQALYSNYGNGGVPPRSVIRKMQEIVYPYDVCLLKTEESLTRALNQILRVIRDYGNRMGADDPHTLMTVIETKGMLFATEMFLRASLLRKESRAGHYREDHPYLSEDGLCWYYLKKGEDGNPDFTRVPVPMEQYKHKVEKFYSHNFTFIEH